jgi:UDP-2,4-diacetamido-2,4,6-trideoxy-beta-L-altropyranose hydrolase
MEHPEEKQLVIRVDASTQIGTGHLMRCLALAQAWKDGGGRVTFITACQTEGLLQRLREEGSNINLLDKPYPDAGDWSYTKDVLVAHPDAWVVLDGYHFDEVYQQQIKDAGHRLLVIDDMAHLKHYYADIVLNQNLHAEELDYSCEPYTRLLLGTHYVLLRREFLAWRGWKREVPKIAQQVLVTLGGSNARNFMLKLIQVLQKVDVPNLEAVVVVGASNPHAEVLEAAIRQSSTRIRLIHNARNMPELMAWADVVVSAGGSTVWELAFMGLPTLVLVLSENQQGIAIGLEAEGIASNLGWHTLVTEADLVSALSELIYDVHRRQEMSGQGHQLVNGHGTEKLVAILKDANV